MTTSVIAAFEGPYSLTPPSPAVYSGQQVSTNYGHWSVQRLQATVNTSNAPAKLVLEVPAHSFFANGLGFRTLAAANGTVSFDCTTVSTYSGNITWTRQRAGGNPTYVPLDSGPVGVPQHFDFPVQAGDVFGFYLGSGGDAINPGDPWMHTLTVEYFIAPVPPILTLQSPTILRWQGGSNLVYTIQTTTNLAGTNWITIGTASSPTTDVSFTNQDDGALQRFFRVICP
jgi:hypothetical protein